MINYEGIDEATLIHGLYHGTGTLSMGTPAGLIDRMQGGSRVTLEKVREDIPAWVDSDGVLRIDYYSGRPLKVDVDTNTKTFEERLYDRDAGQGAAARVVASLLAKAA